MSFARSVCRRARPVSVPYSQSRTSPSVTSAGEKIKASSRLLSSRLTRIAASGIRQCVSGHGMHSRSTVPPCAHEDSQATASSSFSSSSSSAMGEADEMLCRALHYAEAYFAACRAQLTKSSPLSSTTTKSNRSAAHMSLPVVVCLDEAGQSGARRVRTLRDVAEARSDEDTESSEARDGVGHDDQTNEAGATICLSPTYAECSQTRVHVLLQQWISYAAMRVAAPCFGAYQSRIAALLLPRVRPALLLSSQPHLVRSPEEGAEEAAWGASERLWRALVRRGAKSYIELLQRHEATPHSAAEWQHMCDILCVHVREPKKKAKKAECKVGGQPIRPQQHSRIPLLPSGMTGLTLANTMNDNAALVSNEGDDVAQRPHSLSAWALLAEMTTREECVALLRWSRMWAAASVVATQDIAHVWQRGSFAGGHDATQAMLVRWWLEACKAQQDEEEQVSRSDRVMQASPRRVSSAAAAALQRYISAAHNTSSNYKDDSKDEAVPSAAAIAPDGVRHRNELVLRGAWRELLDGVYQHALRLTRGDGSTRVRNVQAEGEEDAVSFIRARLPALGALFNGRRDAAVKTKIVVHARGLLARSTSNNSTTTTTAAAVVTQATSNALPRSLAAAPATAEEVALALRPSLPSLQLHLSASEQAALRAIQNQSGHNDHSEKDDGLAPPPAAIVELRRRLWALACTAAYLPRTLVHLEGTAMWRSARTRKGHTCLPLPYLRRLPAKELLPWLLVAAIGAGVELAIAPLLTSYQSSSNNKIKNTQNAPHSAVNYRQDVHALLAEVKAQAEQSLCSHPPSYAAAAEYTASFCVTSGTSVAEAVVVRGIQRMDSANRGSNDDDGANEARQTARAVKEEMWQRAENVLVEAVDVFFRPSPSDAATSTPWSWSEMTRTTHSNSNNNNNDDGSSSGSSSSVAVRLTPSHVDWLLHKRLCSERNYRVSLYLETLAQVTSSARDLLRAWAQEVRTQGVPLLSPEAAASLTTALLLHDLTHYKHHTATTARSDEGAADVTYREAVLRACGPWLFFVLPSDKTAAHYFRALADRSYLVDCVTRCASSGPAEERNGATNSACVAAELTLDTNWPRSVAALLACRTLRRLERYPTSTAEPFFHLRPSALASHRGHAWNCTMSVPRLTLRLCAVDLVALFAHADARHRAPHTACATTLAQCTREEPAVHELPCVVATQLPYGLAAVYKPAHVNPTLHAQQDSLLFFLARHLPWRTPAASLPPPPPPAACNHEACAVGNDAEDTKRVPVLHQHGLLNRLDRGTSGLMLVADTSAALHAARHASLHSHVLRKSYRALVQYVAPRPAAAWAEQSVWYLPLRGVVHGAIHAEGSSAATLYSLRPHPSYHTPARQEEYDDGDDDDEVEGRDVVELPVASGPRLPTALLDRRVAHTEFRVLEVFPRAGVYYVEATLWAGKRHQIRQHFARIGHPLLGDVLYHPHCADVVRRCRAQCEGRGCTHEEMRAECQRAVAAQCFGLTRPALHAHEIRIGRLPTSQRTTCDANGMDEEKAEGGGCSEEAEVTVVRCELPQDMRDVLQRLRNER